MMKLAILIPVLRRPKNIEPLIISINNTTKASFKTLFITSPGDTEEVQELEKYNQSYITMEAFYQNKGDYARKINAGFNSIEAEWYFLGADDLKFHSDWFEKAMEVYRKTDACVIGTNDLGNPNVLKGQHATHSLTLRDYALECGTIDEPGKILHEGYCHNFVDNEFVETAKWRGAWAFSFQSQVEHLHPDWGKTVRDSVYQIGKLGWENDKRYFERRKKLWI